MRGLRRRIEAIIEDVNHEIRVDLGLEQPNPELKTVDTLDVLDVQKTLECEDEEEESEEAKAFEKVLDEIWVQYEAKREQEPEEEPDDLEESPAKALVGIINSL